MTEIDISKIKVGDTVDVRMRVSGVDARNTGSPCGIRVHSSFEYWPPLADIIAHHPAPRTLKVGDRVKLVNQADGRAIIRHIIGDKVWIRWTTTGFETIRDLSDLEPSDD